MKCDKCGFENLNHAEFCSNCGNRLVNNNQNDNMQVNNQNNNTVQQNNTNDNKKKSNSKIIIICVVMAIILIIIAGIFIYKKLSKFDDPFEDVDNLSSVEVTDDGLYGVDIEKTSYSKIEEDYKNGKLSKDEYIMQLGYSFFDEDKMNSKYKSNSELKVNPVRFFEKTDELINDLSEDTQMYVIKKYLLADVALELESGDAKNSSSIFNKNNNIEKTNIVAERAGNVNKLNKMIVSKNANFIVYYADEGLNKTTYETASKISNYLEETVETYKKKFGFEYKYSIQTQSKGMMSFNGKLLDMLLKGVDYTKAMPVYLLNLGESNVAGFYVGEFNNIWASIGKLKIDIKSLFVDQGIGYNSITTTYALPYFIADSQIQNFDDFKIVLSHELFHHYQNYICGNGKYKDCSSGDFTIETTANLVAANVTNIDNINTMLNDHSAAYSRFIETSIDKTGEERDAIGYPAYIFLNNYAHMVNNGFNKAFESLKYTEPLKYLYENSDGKYENIMIETATKVLTLNYDNHTLLPYRNKQVVYPKAHKNIDKYNESNNETINYSSSHYYYVDPSIFDDNTQLTFNGKYKDLTLLLFVREDNKYKHVYTYNLDKEFVINIDEFNAYDKIAFAIVDTKISGTSSYSFEVKEDGNKKVTVTPDGLGLKTNAKTTYKEISCFTKVNDAEDDDLVTYAQILVRFDNRDKINDLYFKGTLKLKNYDPNDKTFYITQKILSAGLYVLQKTYEEEYKNFKIITKEGKDKYSVTLKIIDDYYTELNKNFKEEVTTKKDILNALKKEGYTCIVK